MKGGVWGLPGVVIRSVGGLVDYRGGEPEQWLQTIGDISFSHHWVLTPTGTHPIRRSVWTVTDMSHYEESVSALGVVLAILFVWFCLLGLLFLLMKDGRYAGPGSAGVRSTRASSPLVR